MNYFNDIVIMGGLVSFFVLGFLTGIASIVSKVKKKGTIKMESGVLRYIPNTVLDSDTGDIQ